MKESTDTDMDATLRFHPQQWQKGKLGRAPDGLGTIQANGPGWGFSAMFASSGRRVSFAARDLDSLITKLQGDGWLPYGREVIGGNVESIQDIKAAIQKRIREQFSGRDSEFLDPIPPLRPGPGAGGMPGFDYVVSVRTKDDAFQWSATGREELLAWSRLLAMIPTRPRIYCDKCDRLPHDDSWETSP